MNVDVTRSKDEGRQALAADGDVRVLFHRLNNQLGIILAHAELLDAKAVDDVSRARAGQIVTSVLEAMGTAREIRRRTDVAETGQVGA